MIRSDCNAIQRAAEAFQRSVLSLNIKGAEARARAWPGTKHIEAAVDEYLEATQREPRVDKPVPPPPTMSQHAIGLLQEYYQASRAQVAIDNAGGLRDPKANDRLRAAYHAFNEYIVGLESGGA